MSAHPFLQAVHDTWLGQVTRAYAPVFTTGLVIHFIGLCFLLGAMLVVDLRILGLGKQVPIKAVLGLLPVAIVAFLANLMTGLIFFTFDPFGYWQNPAFKIKLVLLAIAGLNAVWFTFVEHRKLDTTPAGHDAPALAKVSAGLSLFVWFAVILFGRLIVAFQGSPDLFK
jgi:hypothetical protein